MALRLGFFTGRTAHGPGPISLGCTRNHPEFRPVFTPLVVSIGDRLLLKTDLPPALWPCVLVSLLGALLMGLAQSPWVVQGITQSSDLLNHEDEEAQSRGVTEFTSRDLIGCVMQLVSVIFASSARLLVKKTQGILSRDEIVQANNISNCLFPFLYTLMVHPTGWRAYRYIFTLPNFAAWATIAVVVFTIGFTGQMSLVRSMGPAMYSSLSGTRILGSALLSAIFLAEPVKNWVEWVGLLIIMVTMTLYTVSLLQDSSFPALSKLIPFQEGDVKRKENVKELDEEGSGYDDSASTNLGTRSSCDCNSELTPLIDCGRP